MPKMMENMDPEQKKEMEEMQRKMGGGGDLVSMFKEAMGGEEVAQKPASVNDAPRGKRSKRARR